MPAGPLAGTGPRDPQRAAGPQAHDQLTLQRTPALHIQRLVDRLVGDPHRLIIGEVQRQPTRDLLRAPRPGPSAVLSPRLVQALPRLAHRSGNWLAPRATDDAVEPVWYERAQPLVRDELGRLEA